MLSTHQYVDTYQGVEISQRLPGFEFTPITLGKIASFIVRDSEGAAAVFAFMYSPLSTLDTEPIDEAVLLSEAVATIEGYIEAGRVADHHDMTFVYRAGSFAEVVNPPWWIPTWE